jgi:hypothetical protein
MESTTQYKYFTDQLQTTEIAHLYTPTRYVMKTTQDITETAAVLLLFLLYL